MSVLFCWVGGVEGDLNSPPSNRSPCNAIRIHYHPAAKDGILNSWGSFCAIRWHNIYEILPPWIILCHPLGEIWLPKQCPVTLHIADVHYLKNRHLRDLATKTFACITYSKAGLSQICVGIPMALHTFKLQVPCDV